MSAYLGALAEASNRATFSRCIEVRDNTGQLFDLSDVQEIVFQIINETYPNFVQFGYGLGFGGYLGAQMLTATLTGGKIRLIETGVFQVVFTRSEMNSLPGGNYNCGMAITKDEQTAEIFIGTLPVREGIVTVSAGSG